MAAGDLFSVLGDWYAGQARGRQLALKAQLEAQNAYMARQAAASELATGNAEAGRLGMKTSQLVGQQKAGYASGGVDVSAGSPLQAMADTRMMSSLDQQTILNNAARRAFGYQVQATQDTAQSKLYTQENQDNGLQTFLSMGGDMLKGTLGTFMNSSGG